MHAFLILGKNKEDRDREIASRIAAWKISSWDTIRLTSESPSIGIESVRDFVRALTQSPLNSPFKVGVIEEIERLTTEAQNALLKTLEEPPPHTYLLAETSAVESLLPTILSRFLLVNLGAGVASNEEKNTTKQMLIAIAGSGIANRLQRVDELARSREDGRRLVDAMLTTISTMLHEKDPVIPTHALTRFTRKLLAARSQLAVNVNPRLVLDNVFISISES